MIRLQFLVACTCKVQVFFAIQSNSSTNLILKKKLAKYQWLIFFTKKSWFIYYLQKNIFFPKLSTQKRWVPGSRGARLKESDPRAPSNLNNEKIHGRWDEHICDIYIYDIYIWYLYIIQFIIYSHIQSLVTTNEFWKFQCDILGCPLNDYQGPFPLCHGI